MPEPDNARATLGWLLFFCIFVSMVSVIEVYTILKNLANKEQKGFITPDVFNSFASVAQRKIINEMFDELEANKRKARVGQDLPRRISSYQALKEDVAGYIKSHDSTNSEDGIHDIPSDCRKDYQYQKWVYGGRFGL